MLSIVEQWLAVIGLIAVCAHHLWHHHQSLFLPLMLGEEFPSARLLLRESQF